MGAWFTPPVDYDEMVERIGLNERYEEYAIHDYELPFEIDEYTPIEEVNRLCEMVEDLPDYIQDELRELAGHFGGIEELCDNQDRIFYYPDCEDMADLAEHFLYETGTMDSVPEELRDYIDFEAYGRNLETSGTYIETNHGIYEIGW